MTSYLHLVSVVRPYGGCRTVRMISFNKELCRAIQWWEQKTGHKFTGKLKAGRSQADYHYSPGNHTLTLNSSDIARLFHELQHFLQSKVQPNCTIHNHWRGLRRRRLVSKWSYNCIPQEQDANRWSGHWFRLFCKEKGVTH